MTTLADHERLATEVCFDRELADTTVAQLAGGDALADARWRIYRDMIRARFRKVVIAALPRTVKALGEGFEARFATWLDEAPPATRFFREVPTGFVAHLVAALETKPSDVPHLRDLARYELARWRVLASPDDPPADELSFERPPQLTGALELLDVAHSVQAKKGEPQPGVFHLAIYRAPKGEVFEAVTLELNELARDLLRAWSDPSETPLAARVQAVTAARGTAIDERFLDGLGTLLEDLLRRGVVLGARHAS
ncbi:MAG: hypothetical protein R3B99_11015 [Polyangiales bacterium]